MLSVTSHRHFVRFYLAILALFLFFGLMATFVVALHAQAINKFGECVLWAMGAACAFSAIYVPYKYIKNAPVITVDTHEISFNSRTYNWGDIESISLTDKIPFRHIFRERIEGATFRFKDGSVEYGFDRMYTDLWKIKQFVEQVLIEKKIGSEIIEIKSGHENGNEPFDYYKGIIGVQGSMSVLLILIILGLILFKQNEHTASSLRIASILIIGILLLTSFLWYYFGVSSNYLIVKNIGFFWIKETFSLADIREVVIETKDKRPDGLRIITKDFKTRLYYAESLTNKKWRLLKGDLESKGIKVRVETYIGED